MRGRRGRRRESSHMWCPTPFKNDFQHWHFSSSDCLCCSARQFTKKWPFVDQWSRSASHWRWSPWLLPTQSLDQASSTIKMELLPRFSTLSGIRYRPQMGLVGGYRKSRKLWSNAYAHKRMVCKVIFNSFTRLWPRQSDRSSIAYRFGYRPAPPTFPKHFKTTRYTIFLKYENLLFDRK